MSQGVSCVVLGFFCFAGTRNQIFKLYFYNGPVMYLIYSFHSRSYRRRFVFQIETSGNFYIYIFSVYISKANFSTAFLTALRTVPTNTEVFLCGL